MIIPAGAAEDQALGLDAAGSDADPVFLKGNNGQAMNVPFARHKDRIHLP